jgi:hypothetical protein
MTILVWVFSIIGLVSMALAVPLILGKIPPNRWYGYRTKRTLERNEIWYLTNAYAGKWLLGSGLWVLFAVFSLKAIRHISAPMYALGVLGVLIIMLAVGAGMVSRFVNSL